MKKLAIVLFISVLAFASAGAEGGKCQNYALSHHHIDHWDDVDLRFDGGTIVMIHNGYPRSRIEITEDYELYINGDHIRLNDEQQELVKEYYLHCTEIVEYAREIGIEGAKIGFDGAKIGLKAVGGILRMLLTDYDEDDLERDLEIDTEHLEARAEALEDWAEEIEEMAEDMEELAEEMTDEIPELEELDWF
ncbi:MAG: DUF2884 family protein [Candidatus Zixiibacteriota bacterium]|nr:MAG: DUF2884 family protein [candidate division Zixibacteria bacterium]